MAETSVDSLTAFYDKYGITSNEELHSYKTPTIGRGTGKVKNPVIKVDDDTYIMYAEHDTEIILDAIALQRLSEYETMYKHSLIFYRSNNVIMSRGYDKKTVYIHHIITGQFGDKYKSGGQRRRKVVHLDGNVLNNKSTNLHIQTPDNKRDIAQMVADKTTSHNTETIHHRIKKMGNQLPDEITPDMLRKYVSYRKFKYQGCKSEMFTINGCPLLSRSWNGTSSSTMTTLEKLQQANTIVDRLFAGTLTEAELFDQSGEFAKPRIRKSKNPLPEGITLSMMPKYLIYCSARENSGDYFTINKHPKITGSWCSNRANTYTAMQKYQQAIQVLNDINADKYPHGIKGISIPKPEIN